MQYGFVKIAAAVPSVRVADCRYNRLRIEELMKRAACEGVEVVCFPELSLTAYTCQDLFFQDLLLTEAEAQLQQLLVATQTLPVVALVGMPVVWKSGLLNGAVVIQQGKIKGIVPKTYLPNYKEFYERRWFTSALAAGDTTVRLCGQTVAVSSHLLFRTPTYCFGIELCEDLWSPVPPSSRLALQGAEIIFNLSASNESVGKEAYLRGLIQQQSARCLSGYVLAGSGYGESTQDVIFAGKAFICENGVMLKAGERFSKDEQLIIAEIDVERLASERRQNTTFAVAVCNEAAGQTYETIELTSTASLAQPFVLTRAFDPHPFVPGGNTLDNRCRDILLMQAEGLAKRMEHTDVKTVVVGVSGGLDSTLALLVAVKAFRFLSRPVENIVGVTMPGFGTTSRTCKNALDLMKALGVSVRKIDITKACEQHLADIGHDLSLHDVTYENAQARERTQILMDIANQTNGLVVGTGDMSELALGWATYNGDHISMYGVNVSIPKTLVRHLVAWVARNEAGSQAQATLLDIISTPVSPELLPADASGKITQKTEDLVGPYELHDFFLYYLLRYGFRPAKIFLLAGRAFGNLYTQATIKQWLMVFLRRFFAQQFKRSCLPDGPKVGSLSLSPRGDWRMPSDASATSWIDECNNLKSDE